MDIEHEDAKQRVIQKYKIKERSYDEEEVAKLTELVKGHIASNEEEECMIRESSRLSLIRFAKMFGSHRPAFEGWLAATKWMKEYGVTSLKKDDDGIEEEHRLWRCSYTGCKDVCGRPVALTVPGSASSKDIPSMTRYTICCVEESMSHCDADIADNVCFIFDMKGFGLRNMNYSYTKHILWLLQNYYPERLGVSLLVNAPWVFSGCWQLIRPWVDEVVASRVIFINNKEHLNDFVDTDKLPVALFT